MFIKIICALVIGLGAILLTMWGPRDQANNRSGDVVDDVTSVERNHRPRTFNTSLLEGAWWNSESDNHAIFAIIGDSLYYTQDLEHPLKSEISGDTLILTQDEHQSLFILEKLTVDSLIFHDLAQREQIKMFKMTEQ